MKIQVITSRYESLMRKKPDFRLQGLGDQVPMPVPDIFPDKKRRGQVYRGVPETGFPCSFISADDGRISQAVRIQTGSEGNDELSDLLRNFKFSINLQYNSHTSPCQSVSKKKCSKKMESTFGLSEMNTFDGLGNPAENAV